MRININSAECIGCIDSWSSWFQKMYEDVDTAVEDYIFLHNNQRKLVDAVLESLKNTFDEEILLTWDGSYDSDLKNYESYQDETWFIRFSKSDDTLTYDVLECYANYLVNGDTNNLEPQEIEEIDNAVEREEVDFSHASYEFEQGFGLCELTGKRGDLMTFTVLLK